MYPVKRPATVKILRVRNDLPGGVAQVVARAIPGAIARLEYTTPRGTMSVAVGLGPKRVPLNGEVTWEWVIGTETYRGTGEVMVLCNGESDVSTMIVP
jgi:hypothetical protein